jgi:hypothetical protein
MIKPFLEVMLIVFTVYFLFIMLENGNKLFVLGVLIGILLGRWIEKWRVGIDE